MSRVQNEELKKEISKMTREDLEQVLFVLTRQMDSYDPTKSARRICRGNVLVKSCFSGLHYAW